MNIISRSVSSHSSKKSSSSTSCAGRTAKAEPSGCFSKITSAKCGYCFSSTLNLRLICALLLSIRVAIMVKSHPYSLNSRTKAAMSLGVQMAAFLAGLLILLSLRLWMRWRASSSMAVEMVETDSMLVLSWEWQSSTVKQKTLPALPEPEEGAGLVEVHAAHAGIVAGGLH
jgi:hypothetical protein